MPRNSRSLSTRPFFRQFDTGTALKVCGLLAATLLLIVYFGRPAVSQHSTPNPTLDALPQLNTLALHKADAEEYARQIKSRYAQDSIEYKTAEERYTAAATAFGLWVDSVEQSIKADSDVKNSKEFKDLAKTAVDASAQFHSLAESTLHLGRSSRTAGLNLPDTNTAVEASSKLQKAYGKKADKDKQYLTKDLRSLVKWKPWSDVPPTAAVNSTGPMPAPSAPPIAPGASASPQPSVAPPNSSMPG